MVNTQQAQMYIDDLKHAVKGIYREKDKFMMVLDFDEEEQTLDVLRLTDFGILQQEFNVPYKGLCFMFPNDLNMIEMLDNPFGWCEFMKQFD